MTIAEVSGQYDISADALRYYERMGLPPHVGHTSGGTRNYSEDDCYWVEYIKCMRSTGVSVEALLEYVALFHQGASTIQARKNFLLKQREQIAARVNELNRVLARLGRKLDGYEEWMPRCEEHLKQFCSDMENALYHRGATDQKRLEFFKHALKQMRIKCRTYFNQ